MIDNQDTEKLVWEDPATGEMVALPEMLDSVYRDNIARESDDRKVWLTETYRIVACMRERQNGGKGCMGAVEEFSPDATWPDDDVEKYRRDLVLTHGHKLCLLCLRDEVANCSHGNSIVDRMTRAELMAMVRQFKAAEEGGLPYEVHITVGNKVRIVRAREANVRETATPPRRA